MTTKRMTSTNEWTMDACCSLIMSTNHDASTRVSAENVVRRIGSLLDETCEQSSEAHSFRNVCEFCLFILREERQNDTPWPTVARNMLLEIGRVADVVIGQIGGSE